MCSWTTLPDKVSMLAAVALVYGASDFGSVGQLGASRLGMLCPLSRLMLTPLPSHRVVCGS